MDLTPPSWSRAPKWGPAGFPPVRRLVAPACEAAAVAVRRAAPRRCRRRLRSARWLEPRCGWRALPPAESACFLLNAISYVAVLLAILAMRDLPVRAASPQGHVLEHLKEGFVYAFGFAPLRTLLLMLAVGRFRILASWDDLPAANSSMDSASHLSTKSFASCTTGVFPPSNQISAIHSPIGCAFTVAPWSGIHVTMHIAQNWFARAAERRMPRSLVLLCPRDA